MSVAKTPTLRRKKSGVSIRCGGKRGSKGGAISLVGALKLCANRHDSESAAGIEKSSKNRVEIKGIGSA